VFEDSDIMLRGHKWPTRWSKLFLVKDYFWTLSLMLLAISMSIMTLSCRDNDEKPSAPSDENPVLVSAFIPAATGGTVTIPPPHQLTGTSIAIPAGALAADAIITIRAASLPSVPGATGLAIDIGPNGTAFRIPVTVTITYADTDLPERTAANRLFLAKIEAQGTLTLLANVLVDKAAHTVSGTTTSLSVFFIGVGDDHLPLANAGPDQTVTAGTTVQLDGSESSDTDGDPLAFQWALIATPAGSAATLFDSHDVHPTFRADQPGSYVVTTNFTSH